MNSSSIQQRTVVALAIIAVLSTAEVQSAQCQLSNGRISVEFHAEGLARLSDSANHSVGFVDDSFSIAINGKTFSGSGLKQLEVQSNNEMVTYRYQAGKWILRVVYELKPTWHFVSKQVVLEPGGTASVTVNSVEVFAAEIKNPVGHQNQSVICSCP